jgi:pimeloyl-ACP methyl ester carboxylesterase
MLQHRIEGTGEPLLLIHGFGVTFSIWQNLAPLLTAQFQTIMIELPGIGDSPPVSPGKPYYAACAEAIEELRRELGIETWAILAYSSGTRVADEYAQRYARHVSRAVLLCPLHVREWMSLGLRFGRQLETLRPNSTTWIFTEWRLHGLVVALGFNGRRHEYTYLWTNEIQQQPLESLMRSVYELPGKGRDPFSLGGVPSLFIWGRRDAITARPRRPRPNDLLIRANHSAPMIAADQIAAAVIPFLRDGVVSSPGGARRVWRMLPPAAQAIGRRAIVVARATTRRGRVLARMRRKPAAMPARASYRAGRMTSPRGLATTRAARRRLAITSRPFGGRWR